ncbi:MAG: AAA family ATPase [Planctomycetales bacterium]|nr:AAA family ATPase [Planctomycetales bacterium]
MTNEATPHADAKLLADFRQALVDCRRLFVDRARELVDSGRCDLRGTPQQFLTRMDDLHRGLLLKVYVDVARTDWRWQRAEEELATELVEHIWGRRLDRAQTRAALQNIVTHSSELRYGKLVRPFEEIAALRVHRGALEGIVTRVANLVAKIDGQVHPDEVKRIRTIHEEIRRHLYAVPLDDGPTDTSGAMIDDDAAGQIAADADQVRQAYELATDDAPRGTSAMKTSATITSTEDTVGRVTAASATLAELRDELRRLVGMANVKREIDELVDFLQVQREREKRGLPTTDVTLHMVFRGNPGTGKTTVARLLGRIFGTMGVLAKGHLVETDRSGLVARFAGQTGPKTNQLVDSALDGVLFIDEAYSLVASRGDDAYGEEAVQALLKRVEDDRHRLVTILAGYPRPMDEMLRSNPGLSSRFSRRLTFLDYNAAELGEIFELMCSQNEYRIPLATRIKLLLGFRFLLNHRDEHFGNGRLVRNVFEATIRRQASRIVGIAPLTHRKLVTLRPIDVEFDGVPESVFQRLHDERRRYDVVCPHCTKTSGATERLLLRKVRCKKCGERFRVRWAVPV